MLATTAAYVQQIGMLSLSSTLALSVATMEFEVIKKRLQGIEESLQRIEESLQQIQSKLDNVEDKLDLNIFSNFQAALDQAGNSSSMNNPENRRNSAHQAINRFLEAEHYYADLYKYELSKGRGEAVLDILHILSLAYVSEARCHLELGEAQTANQRLSKAREQLEFCVRELIQCTLTHNPAMYLNPAMQEKGVGLDRLTHYMQWLDPSLTPCSVFEALRGDLWEFAGGGKIIDRWLDSLPLMLWDPQVDEPKNRRGRRKEISNKEKLQILLLRLPDALLRVDSAIECHGRLQGFELETQVLARERITLQKWQQLTSVKQSNEQPFSYVKLLKPISVDSYN